jgi:hypothetical protein
MELANTRLCLVCSTRPREVRVQCGHLFACTKCIEGLSICVICRKPIYANYNIRHTAGGSASGSANELGRGYDRGAGSESDRGSGSDSQQPGEGIGVRSSPALAGYISSGSETFVDIVQKPCLICNQPATLRFSCSCLGEGLQAASQAKLIVVCATCAASLLCPNCSRRASLGTDFEELSIRTSSRSSGSSARSDKQEYDLMLDSHDVMSPPSEVLATHCASENTIIELPTNRMQLAAEVCRLCLRSQSHGKAVVDSKAVVVAATVPLVRQHAQVIRQVTSLRAKTVIGNAEVEAWTWKQWSEAMCEVDVLVTTPQLFLDSLDAKSVKLDTFCVLVVDECQLCSGSHPFARIFREHYSLLQPRGQIRVLGLSQKLVRSKWKATPEKELLKVKCFEVLMDSRRMEQSIVWDAYSKQCGAIGSEKESMVPTQPRLSLLQAALGQPSLVPTSGAWCQSQLEGARVAR